MRGQELHPAGHLSACAVKKSLKGMQLLPGGALGTTLRAAPAPQGHRVCAGQPCPVWHLPLHSEVDMLRLLPAYHIPGSTAKSHKDADVHPLLKVTTSKQHQSG